jgi:hypothetical protein
MINKKKEGIAGYISMCFHTSRYIRKFIPYLGDKEKKRSK